MAPAKKVNNEKRSKVVLAFFSFFFLAVLSVLIYSIVSSNNTKTPYVSKGDPVISLMTIEASIFEETNKTMTLSHATLGRIAAVMEAAMDSREGVQMQEAVKHDPISTLEYINSTSYLPVPLKRLLLASAEHAPVHRYSAFASVFDLVHVPCSVFTFFAPTATLFTEEEVEMLVLFEVSKDLIKDGQWTPFKAIPVLAKKKALAELKKEEFDLKSAQMWVDEFKLDMEIQNSTTTDAAASPPVALLCISSLSVSFPSLDEALLKPLFPSTGSATASSADAALISSREEAQALSTPPDRLLAPSEVLPDFLARGINVFATVSAAVVEKQVNSILTKPEKDGISFTEQLQSVLDASGSSTVPGGTGFGGGIQLQVSIPLVFEVDKTTPLGRAVQISETEPVQAKLTLRHARVVLPSNLVVTKQGEVCVLVEGLDVSALSSVMLSFALSMDFSAMGKKKGQTDMIVGGTFDFQAGLGTLSGRVDGEWAGMDKVVSVRDALLSFEVGWGQGNFVEAGGGKKALTVKRAWFSLAHAVFPILKESSVLKNNVTTTGEGEKEGPTLQVHGLFQANEAAADAGGVLIDVSLDSGDVAAILRRFLETDALKTNAITADAALEKLSEYVPNISDMGKQEGDAGDVSLTLSSFRQPQWWNGKEVPAGISLMVSDVRLAPTSSAQKSWTLIQQALFDNSPTSNSLYQLDLACYIPMFRPAVAPHDAFSVSLSARNIPLPRFGAVITFLTFNLNSSNNQKSIVASPVDPDATAEEGARVTIVDTEVEIVIQPFTTSLVAPVVSSPSTFRAALSYDSQARTFKFNSKLKAQDRFLGLPWLYANEVELDMLINQADKKTAEGSVAMSGSYEMNLSADLSFKFEQEDYDASFVSSVGSSLLQGGRVKVQAKIDREASQQGGVLQEKKDRILFVANGIALTSILPRLGAAVQGNIDLLISNYHTEYTPEPIAAPLKAGQTVPVIPEESTVAGEPVKVVPGLTLHARAVKLSETAFGGAIAAVGSVKGSSFQLLGFVQFRDGATSSSSNSTQTEAEEVSVLEAVEGSLKDGAKYRLQLQLKAKDLVISSAVKLPEVSFILDLQHVPGHAIPRIIVHVDASITITLPRTEPIKALVVADYNSVERMFFLEANINEWPKPFGAKWLSLSNVGVRIVVKPNVPEILEDGSQAEGPVTKASRMISISADARFKTKSIDVDASVCGIIYNGDAALVVEGIDIGDNLRGLICDLFKICSETMEILDKLTDIIKSVNLALAVKPIPASAWKGAGSLCKPEYAIPESGLTISVILEAQGALMEKLQKVLHMKSLAKDKWVFTINIPFNIFGDSDKTEEEAMHYMQGMVEQSLRKHAEPREEARTMHPLALLLPPLDQQLVSSDANAVAVVDVGSVDHQNRHMQTQFLQNLAVLNNFNLNFEKHNLRVKVMGKEWLILTGASIQGRPLKQPVPVFTAALSCELYLQNQVSPLLFDFSGAVNPTGAIKLAGSMRAVGGWKNAMGIQGLTVYGVKGELGIGIGRIESIGLEFNLALGRINVQCAAYAALDFTNEMPSFVFRGKIAADDGEGGASGVAQPKLSFVDLAQFLQKVSQGKITIPPQWIPSAQAFELDHVAFSIATRSGVDAVGKAFNAGFSVSSEMTLFGIQFAFEAGTFRRNIGSVPMLDFKLSFKADFSRFNKAIVDWIASVVPFDGVKNWLKERLGSSICDLACIQSFSMTDFSLVDMIQGKFPSFEMVFHVAGRRIAVGPISLDIRQMKSSAKEFFDSIKSAIKDKFPSFCVHNRNCPAIERWNAVKGENEMIDRVCDHTSGWRCVEDKCPVGTRDVFGTGCWPSLRSLSDGEWKSVLNDVMTLSSADANKAFTGAVNVADPVLKTTPAGGRRLFGVDGEDEDDWFVQAQVDPYDPVAYAKSALDRTLYRLSPVSKITDSGKKDVLEALQSYQDQLKIVENAKQCDTKECGPPLNPCESITCNPTTQVKKVLVAADLKAMKLPATAASCCATIPTCERMKCAAGTKLFSKPKTITCASFPCLQSECCVYQPTCAQDFECPITHRLIENAAPCPDFDLGGCSLAHCCLVPDTCAVSFPACIAPSADLATAKDRAPDLSLFKDSNNKSNFSLPLSTTSTTATTATSPTTKKTRGVMPVFCAGEKCVEAECCSYLPEIAVVGASRVGASSAIILRNDGTPVEPEDGRIFGLSLISLVCICVLTLMLLTVVAFECYRCYRKRRNGKAEPSQSFVHRDSWNARNKSGVFLASPYATPFLELGEVSALHRGSVDSIRRSSVDSVVGGEDNKSKLFSKLFGTKSVKSGDYDDRI